MYICYTYEYIFHVHMDIHVFHFWQNLKTNTQVIVSGEAYHCNKDQIWVQSAREDAWVRRHLRHRWQRTISLSGTCLEQPTTSLKTQEKHLCVVLLRSSWAPFDFIEEWSKHNCKHVGLFLLARLLVRWYGGWCVHSSLCPLSGK